MLEGYRKGYAVMTPDFEGIGFEHESLEKCKEYCYNGDVIVEAIPKKYGINIEIKWYRPYKWVELRIRRREFNVLWLHVRWWHVYRHKYGREVLYTGGKYGSRKGGFID